MEFINLNEDTSLVNVTEETNLLVKKEPSIQLLDDSEIPQLDYIPKTNTTEEDTLLQGSCGIEDFYGDASVEDYFKRENLFSELVNDYQRAMARYNLGIGEEYSLVWGNITGSIENQQDLYNYINNQLTDYFNSHTETINNLLTQWANDINLQLSQKLNKYSPNLEGIPTTTLPEIDDNSSRVASTEWVNARLENSEDYNLKWIKLNKTSMFFGDTPQTIILTWDFYNNPAEVYINGISINPSSREYSFPNIDSSFSIHFSYKMNDKWYNKIITFEKVHAYYYGTDSIISSMTKTKNSLMIVNSSTDKFVYLYIPNDGNARLFVDNILGGFKVIGNTLINGIVYHLYRTVNSGLGQLYIKYDKQ